MSQRQANIQLLNSKLAELDFSANTMLWEKIEAQLAAPPSVAAEKPGGTNNTFRQLLSSHTVTSFFIAAVMLVAGVIFYQEKKATPPAMPQNTISPVVTPTPVLQGKKDSTFKKQPLIPHKKLLPAVDSIPARALHKLTGPPGISTDRNLLHLPIQDSLNAPSPVVLITDSSKAASGPAKDDGYYFDVKKKEKRKN